MIIEVLLIEGFPLNNIVEKVKSFNKNIVQKATSDFCEHSLSICLEKKVEDETTKSLSLGDNDILIYLDNVVSGAFSIFFFWRRNNI